MKLSNGAIIYKFGEPKLFIMAGAHGEEIAPVIALESLIHKKLKNVWILPCLNKKGYGDDNRKYSILREGKSPLDYDLNREYKLSTKLPFMKELQDLIREYKPEIFVDMHEHIDESMENDFIWSSLANKNGEIESKLREFCCQQRLGIIYQPTTREYKTSSDFFARRIGVPNAYTTETYKYSSLKKRITINKKFIKFFLKIVADPKITEGQK